MIKNLDQDKRRSMASSGSKSSRGSRGSRAGKRGGGGSAGKQRFVNQSLYGTMDSAGSTGAKRRGASRDGKRRSMGSSGSRGSAAKHGNSKRRDNASGGSRGQSAGSRGKSRPAGGANRMSKAINARPDKRKDRKPQGFAAQMRDESASNAKQQRTAAPDEAKEAKPRQVDEAAQQQLLDAQRQAGGPRPFRSHAVLAQNSLAVIAFLTLLLLVSTMVTPPEVGGWITQTGAPPSPSAVVIEALVSVVILSICLLTYLLVGARSLRGVRIMIQVMAGVAFLALVYSVLAFGQTDGAGYGLVGVIYAAINIFSVFTLRKLHSVLQGGDIRRLTPAQCERFSKALQQNQTSPEERVGGVRSDGAAKIAAGLTSNKSTIFIDFEVSITDRTGAMGPAGARSIVGAAGKNKNLMALNLRNNSLGPSGGHAVAGAISSSGLVYLDLADNAMGNDAAVAVMTAVASKPSFQNINLAGNAITDKAAVAIAKQLRSRANNAERLVLDLRYNPIQEQGFDDLVKVAETLGPSKLFLQIGDFEDGSCCV